MPPSASAGPVPTPPSRRPGRARRLKSLVAAGVLAATALVATGSSATAAPEATGKAGQAGQEAAAEAPGLKVLSYNAFLFSKLIYPNWGQDHRGEAIPDADFFQGNDVVVLQEAFENSVSDKLQEKAAGQYPHQTPVLGRSKKGWDATGGSWSDIALEDGGVTILSKWPVVHKEQFVYDHGCGADYLSNKGFVYAVLDVGGTRVHVVGTHVQAGDSACGDGEAKEIRADQFRAIDSFLDEKQIPADEEVMVAGDFNTDSRSDEYASMLANADLAPADARTGHPYSSDHVENTIAKGRNDNGKRSDLDYVLHRNGHVRPANWQNEVVKEECAPWETSEGTFTNLSDHYPVIGGPAS
ncbi:sphingomyelin phosphodiesterase [Streptomyces sp. WMMB 322]|uniref:sphingomyelin phosphodiesterase n=1 Tax=Streptomyces sp. WMMB 322 TaxID=1286821 RepID=UPI0006E2C686|nr:sphingomyelin phosphodiesterase [Streptomyces sp. WMMB 322]SCK38825.1 sphingomyelin phosphodiesterase [Streptomyces sp. WMMB 322]